MQGPQTGSAQVTQFIGMIPRSKAPEHFHTYEEAICILSGCGEMWAGDSHAPVRPGSVIFLPRKQPHCLHEGHLEKLIEEQCFHILHFAPGRVRRYCHCLQNNSR